MCGVSPGGAPSRETPCVLSRGVVFHSPSEDRGRVPGDWYDRNLRHRVLTSFCVVHQSPHSEDDPGTSTSHVSWTLRGVTLPPECKIGKGTDGILDRYGRGVPETHRVPSRRGGHTVLQVDVGRRLLTSVSTYAGEKKNPPPTLYLTCSRTILLPTFTEDQLTGNRRLLRFAVYESIIRSLFV